MSSIGFDGPKIGFLEPGGGGGGGGVAEITSSSLTVTNGTGPVVNIEDGPITEASTAISATTAAMGLFNVYQATAAPVTITISTADIVAGREFVFSVNTASVSVGTPVTIDTEGAQLIDGASSIVLTVDHDSANLYVSSGNLVSK